MLLWIYKKSISIETIFEELDDAIEVFKRNIALYPEAANPYDSMGEAYMMAGKDELAIKNYAISIQLNPTNTNATQMIAKLQGIEIVEEVEELEDVEDVEDVEIDE